tara:strand:+ start:1540 stop:2931 length:1392 start_codon:yes stop_codon:yes gene_type:complete
MSDKIIDPGSFRDPSGYVYLREGLIHRRINDCYKDDYEQLINSGLYDKLTEQSYLVKHEETDISSTPQTGEYKNIIPEQIPFISYPYEWSFSQLKDAALLTIDIQIQAIKYDMSLKDASAYNIQFLKSKPIFIDTLSFEKLNEGLPWVAYQQFCKHFLAPLALMSIKDIRLGQLLRVYIDGIPLDMTTKLLPLKTYFSFGILSHLHLQAMAQNRYADSDKVNHKVRTLTKTDLINICESLRRTVIKLSWSPENTEWGNYYEKNNNYSTETILHKEKFVSDSLEKITPKLVWDLGSNTGHFSRLSSSCGFPTISFDIDPACVEINYLESRKKNETELLPLLLDLTNPSPGIGWGNLERSALFERKSPQLILALALIHHLAISNNLPLTKIANLFSKNAPYLVIEFVPKSDSMVKRLLSTREDIFPDYNKEKFEEIFGRYYTILSKENIKNSERIIYLMKSIKVE